MVVCAITDGAELGVDIEPVSRGQEILGLADRVFAVQERDELRALPIADARDRAVSLWTLKEAYVKARGLGLALALDGFAFSFSDRQSPRICFGSGFDDRAERWAFRSRDVNGHRIAVAVERGRVEPVVRFHGYVPLGASLPLAPE